MTPKVEETKESKELKYLLMNPYDAFYDENSIDISPDDIIRDYNEENFKNYLENEVFKDYKKYKAEFINQAIKYDPAFMTNPTQDYYSKFIPDEYKANLSAEELNEIMCLRDPVSWAKKYLLYSKGGWKDRCSQNGIPYQGMIIRSISKRLVVRAGRRIGKTSALVIRILHKAFTFVPKIGKSTYNIVIFTPNQSQLAVIFKMMEVLIDRNPALLSLIRNKEKKIPARQNPNYELDLINGVVIKGFVSGSTAIRGSAANLLFIDEASYLTTDDTDSVVALLTENADTELVISSTPKGLKDWFYDKVHDKSYTSLYFPSDKFHPFWSARMEEEVRAGTTTAGYKHEYLAEFSSDGEGVFPFDIVDAARSSYDYYECRPEPDYTYGMGIDWNSAIHGVNIKIVGYNQNIQKYKLVYSEIISAAGYTQMSAVNKIKILNREWRPAFIYADRGFGTTQIEMLHDIGAKAPGNSPDRALVRVKGVDFKSKTIIYDPYLRQRVPKDTKPLMINNAVRIFENNLIYIPSEDEKLYKQLIGYVIEKYTSTGMPVYKASDPKTGDHDLDALVIALFGFLMEMTTLTRFVPVVAAVSVNHPLKTGSKDYAEEDALFKQARIAQSKVDKGIAMDKEMERQERERYSVNSYGKKEDLQPRRSVAPRKSIFAAKTLKSITTSRSNRF